jgi:NhaP-type Na+/H+ or K+/H+ antiporter
LQNTIKETEEKEQTKPVSDIMAELWSKIGAVMLFTLLGASVDQSKMQPSKILFGCAIVAIGLIGRSIACFGTVSLIREWKAKEKAFAMVAWCPKATVQAALATVSLDYVNKKIQAGDWLETDPITQDYLEMANVILTTAVLSIMLTAPLFAVLMTYTGNRWLENDRATDVEMPAAAQQALKVQELNEVSNEGPENVAADSIIDVVTANSL